MNNKLTYANYFRSILGILLFTALFSLLIPIVSIIVVISLGKLTDWSVDDDGVPDSGSKRRGILTDNFKIAPFFEYYKKELDSLNG